MVIKFVSWLLVSCLIWPSVSWAADVSGIMELHSQMVMPGDTVPGPGMFVPAEKVEKLANDLQDYSILKEKYVIVVAERDKLMEVVAEYKSADLKQKMALDIAEERERLRIEMFSQMKMAMELNTMTLQNTKTFLEGQKAFVEKQSVFMANQQAEIDSLRSERKWLIIFGGIFLIATSALLFFK